MKTSHLINAPLDFAVTICEGYNITINNFILHHQYRHLNFSSEWNQGGIIIERENISICSSHKRTKEPWFATLYPYAKDDSIGETGATPLIAAMRCYVAYKLGDDINIPKALL